MESFSRPRRSSVAPLRSQLRSQKADPPCVLPDEDLHSDYGSSSFDMDDYLEDIASICHHPPLPFDLNLLPSPTDCKPLPSLPISFRSLNREEILGRLTDNREGLDTKKPLPPGELIEMCLRGGPELSLKAFEVFAWTSSSFRISNRSLLEECWKIAADQDDWAVLCQASTREGWSDEIVLECLRNTVLFKASNRCYGLGAENYDGGFEEVLPLQKEDMGFPNLKEASSSVEGLLMQHKDFPDAGKLMLTAILMGKEGNYAVVEEDMLMDSQ
ncbi:putative Nuclear pore complex protein NUP133 [Cocos nucifera]|nr:putative Nuclear pore complex protein NUP133 [Cocos nucifera]